MDTITQNDFSAGWVPSDDPVAGRKNGLLRLENVELDNNGALVMSGGTKRGGTTKAGTCIRMFSKFLGGTRYRYLIMQDGANVKVYRNDTLISNVVETVARGAFGIAWDFILITAGALTKIKDTGAATTDLGLITPTTPVSLTSGGAGNLTGEYTYVQIYVRNNNNGYIAKSEMSPSTTFTAEAEKINVDPLAPSGQATEVWIYRKGGMLDQYYRIGTTTSGVAFDDNLTDQEVLDDGITLNEDVTSLNIAEGLATEQFLEIIGPINRRNIYFTAGKIYFSLLNSPDSVIPLQAISYGGSSSEIFMWAHQIAEDAIMVGTSEQIYILTGTFIEMPDGTLDVYLRSLGISHPPISIHVTHYNNKAVYMSSNGWTLCDYNGNLQFICPPNTDRTYRGNTQGNNAGVPIYIYPNQDAGGTIVRYACAVARNKLWVRVPVIVGNDPAAAFTYRMEVYDFTRNYWRTLSIKPTQIYGEEDGNLIGFFSEDNYIKDIDHQFLKTLENGPTVNQTIDVQTLFHFGENNRNRKDPCNLVFNIDTGNTNLAVTAYKDGNLSSSSSLGNVSSNGLSEKVIDISALLTTAKNFSIRLNGTIPDFRLTRMDLDFEPHPNPIKYLNILRFPLGQAEYRKCRIRTLPLIIDTIGNNVTMTPSVDGSGFAAATINQTGKKIYLYQFLTDAFGVDYSAILQSTSEFEVWEIGSPDIVQALPLAKRFFQVGPIEFFRMGRVKTLQFRLIAFGGTTIPYVFYFEDTVNAYTGNITVTSAKETVVDVPMPKTTEGQVLRFVMGSTAFDFHIIDARAQVMKSGRDTDLEWVSLVK